MLCHFYNEMGDLIRELEIENPKQVYLWGRTVFIRAPETADAFVEVDYGVIPDTAPSGYLRIDRRTS